MELRIPLSPSAFRNELETFPGAKGIKKEGLDSMVELLRRFAADESGATAIEYGLIAAGISVAIITVVQGMGSKLNGTFGKVKNALG